MNKTDHSADADSDHPSPAKPQLTDEEWGVLKQKMQDELLSAPAEQPAGGEREVTVCPGCGGRGGWEDGDEGQWVTCNCEENIARARRRSPPPAEPAPAAPVERELPDEPGVWFRDGREFLVHRVHGDNRLGVYVLDANGYTVFSPITNWSSGNWHRVQPSEPPGEVERLRVERDRLQKHHDFAERFRPQIAEVAGMSGDPHWGDIATVLGARVRALRERAEQAERERDEARRELQAVAVKEGPLNAERITLDELLAKLNEWKAIASGQTCVSFENLCFGSVSLWHQTHRDNFRKVDRKPADLSRWVLEHSGGVRDDFPAQVLGILKQQAEQLTAAESALSAMTKERDEAGLRAMKAEDFILREGYRRCDIAACNCGSWHGGHAGQRLREIIDVLNDADCKPREKTALIAVCELAQERDELRSALAESRERERVLREALARCDRVFLDIYSNAQKLQWQDIEQQGKYGMGITGAALAAVQGEAAALAKMAIGWQREALGQGESATPTQEEGNV